MPQLSAKDRLATTALRRAVAIPFLYFGIQIVAARFVPGYSFLNRDASTLGSEASTQPWIFNAASIALGVITLVAAWGFLQTFKRLEVNTAVAWLTCLAIAAFGVGCINAGVFPLPDARHTAGPLAILGMGSFVLPPLLAAALWRLPRARGLKVFLIVNVAVWLALLPILSGLIQVLLVNTGAQWPAYQNLLNDYHGLLQRIVALIILAPIGAAAYALAGRISLPLSESPAAR